MKQIKIFLSLLILFFFALFLSGCNFDSINATVQRYIGGNREAIKTAENAKIKLEEQNPVFTSEEEIDVQDDIAGQVNQTMKKILGSVFSDSKLVSNSTSNTPFILKYIVKRRINQADGETLYKALLDAESRAKDDAKPNYIASRNTVEFSVYHDFGGRSYILAVVLDLADQSIWVNVY